ncbi:MAG: hypothetical protein R3E91_05685 [Chlamydiales bacterium]
MSIGPTTNYPIDRRSTIKDTVSKNGSQDFIKRIQFIVLLALVGIGIAATVGAFPDTSIALGASVAGLATIFGAGHFFRGNFGNRKFSFITMTLLSLGSIAVASCFLAGGLLTAVSAGYIVLGLSGATGIIYLISCCVSSQSHPKKVIHHGSSPSGPF